MGLGSILGGRPTAAHRPRFDALGRWLLARTAELAAAAERTGRSHWSRRPPSSPTSRLAAPTWSGRGWRRCVTWVSRSSPSRRSTRTATSTATCSTTSRCAAARGWPALLVASADGQAFRLPLEDIARTRHPGPGARISRTCQLGASVGYLGVRRPGGHSWCFPGAATANRPRFAARAGGVAAAVPAAVLATGLARLTTTDRMRGSAAKDLKS